MVATLILGACDADRVGPEVPEEDALAGSWTMQIIYSTVGSDSHSDGTSYVTRTACSGPVPASFVWRGTGTLYTVEFGESPGLCRSIRTYRESSSAWDTLWQRTSDEFIAGALVATRRSDTLTMMRDFFDGSLIISGTMQPTEQGGIVSDGVISGSRLNPGPVISSWSASGTWTMGR